jgi:hypothetical protein
LREVILTWPFQFLWVCCRTVPCNAFKIVVITRYFSLR